MGNYESKEWKEFIDMDFPIIEITEQIRKNTGDYSRKFYTTGEQEKIRQEERDMPLK
ncbi:MAG TPA: hypothetical protein VI911_04835 [Patescibacteria group bacterium]|nr:hypothetical protein [Patescibacteria group bacterium]